MTRYRILSLPGGGARGVFQAEFLSRLERDSPSLLCERFDLIAGTSTGAIVGLPIAAGVAASTVASRIRDLVSTVFVPPGFLAYFRQGAMYSVAPLRAGLEEFLGTQSLQELRTDVVIPVSIADRYEAHILTRESRGSLVDAALASSAAPTYFPPHQFVGSDRRAYLDGGLWANDPTHLAALHAIHYLGIDPKDIDILVVGNGNHIVGKHSDELKQMRRISIDAFRILSEGIMTLQRSHTQKILSHLGPNLFVIEPSLEQAIRLDNARESVRVLLPLVDSEYDRHRASLMSTFLTADTSETSALSRPIPAATEAGIRAANLTTFVPDRSFYKIARGPDDNISNYVSRAQRDLTMVSINLMTGDGFELLLETFRSMIVERDQAVDIRLSLLDPENEHLMGALAPVLDMAPSALAGSIRELINKSLSFKNSLPLTRRVHFSLHAHNAIPPASAIMIDAPSAYGTIQLETKTYRTSPYHSFGFEVSRPSKFYDTLNESYERLIEDGRRIA